MTVTTLQRTLAAKFANRRDRKLNSRRSEPLPNKQSFQLEPFENRLLLSVGRVGVPNRVPEGPAPQISAGNVIGTSPATQQNVGAVNQLAVDPNNSKHVLAETVQRRHLANPRLHRGFADMDDDDRSIALSTAHSMRCSDPGGAAQ